MSILPSYNYATGGLQPASSYTNANLLAANIAEIVSVPTDENGYLAKYVTFNKTSATAVDFYAKPMLGTDASERGYDGTFGEFSTNGTFTTDTGWTKGTGWTISGGKGVATLASTAISQTSPITLVPGNVYTVTVTTASTTAGSVAISLGGGTAGTAITTDTTTIQTLTAGSTQIIAFTGTGYSATIDGVTISGWTLGTGWTTAANVATATGAISTALANTSALALVSGGKYLVTFDLTRSAGSITVALGGGSAGTSRATTATFSEIITAGATQAVSFATTGFTGTLANVSITKCIAVPGDTTDGSAGDLNPAGYFLGGNVSKISIVSAGAPIVTSAFFK